jgi:ABC-type polysaccharide/polyol phosphate export permease
MIGNLPVYDSRKQKIPIISEISEIFRYRFLVRSLITRDLKVRYKRSVIGMIWVTLNPLLTMIVLVTAFDYILNVQIQHYPTYVLSGTVLWNVFSQGSNAAMAAMQGNGQIIRKLYVPPSTFVASAAGSAMVNLIFSLVPLMVIALFVDGLRPHLSWIALIIPIIMITIFTFGLGLILGAMIVFFNDIFEIWQVLLNAFYFLTPVFYSISGNSGNGVKGGMQIPGPVASLEPYNPLYAFMQLIRNPILFNTWPDLRTLAVATIYTVGVVIVGWAFFTRVEDKFVYYF